MAPRRKALIDGSGNVHNVILIEDGANWSPSAGMSLVDAGPDAESGGTYSGGKFSRAPRRVVEPTLEERVAALELSAKQVSR